MVKKAIQANLDIQELKPPEQKACTYSQNPITLDGQMDVKITFNDTVVSTVFVEGGITTLRITNHGKTTCQPQIGIQRAEVVKWILN